MVSRTGTSAGAAARITGSLPMSWDLPTSWRGRPLPGPAFDQHGPSGGCFCLLEDLVDLGNLLQELRPGGRVGRALYPAGAGELGGLVEQRVELRVLREVRGLEVVGPEHPEVVLDQVGPLLLDGQGAGAEGRVVIALVLLLDHPHRLGLDAGLRRVVDTAGQVAVGRQGGRRGQQTP